VVRRCHDGHEQTWWAVDLRLGGTYGPDRTHRLVVATSDPRTLPKASTWYLVTHLPLPGTARAAEHPHLPAADLTEVVQLYGLRQWVEHGYKQVKQELGWGDFQVRSDRAIRRHWALVCGACCFCWWAQSQQDDADAPRALAGDAARSLPLPPEAGAGEKWGPGVPDASGTTGAVLDRAQWLRATAVVATGAAPGAELA
jgi:hypothetical protein